MRVYNNPLNNNQQNNNSMATNIKKNVFKNIFNTQNNQQFISLISAFLSEFISITISNLSIWFIPQSTTYSYDIVQYIIFQEWYIILICLVNLLSWLAFIALYCIEIYREIWLIRNFDYSKRYSSVNLTRYKSDYPEIFSMLDRINYLYFYAYYIIRWIVFTNIIISSSIIIKYNYSDYKTITTLFINFWIAYNKVNSGISIARESAKNNSGNAYFNTLKMSFNRIDPRIKRHISTSNMPSVENSPEGSLNASQIGATQNGTPFQGVAFYTDPEDKIAQIV